MIVKFFSRGTGRGSAPVDYLLGQNRDREGARLDRGDPEITQQIIDSSPYAKKYTSGVLSFAESDLDQKTKDELMNSFEAALFPGLDKDQYSVLWVEHRDKGRLELNFVIPNIELTTGKRLQPWFEKADKPRINAWKGVANAHYGLHDPDDPRNKRELVTPRDLPSNKQQAARAITDGLLNLAQTGSIQNRDDVITAIENAGFTVARKTKTSISIDDPEGGRNIRLKGLIYEQNFRHGEGLRAEIERASQQYREAAEERLRQLHEVYTKGAEIKREELTKRYKRPQQEHETISAKDVVLALAERGDRGISDVGSESVPSAGHSGQLSTHQRAKISDRKTEKSGRKPDLSTVREPEENVHSDGFRNDEIWQQLHDSTGVLGDDRARNDAIGAIRAYFERVRETAKRVSAGIREFNENVQNYLRRERGDSDGINQFAEACQGFEQHVRAINKIVNESERTTYRAVDRGREP